jgi:hypothetical protein
MNTSIEDKIVDFVSENQLEAVVIYFEKTNDGEAEKISVASNLGVDLEVIHSILGVMIQTIKAKNDLTKNINFN